jgi:uncharacterized membrane-anchored protein YhcB (DUF1043 family)
MLFRFPLSLSIIQLILSLLCGFVCGYLIIKLLRQSLQSYHGPDSNVIRKQIYFDDQNRECYQYVPKPYICPTSAKISE